LFVSGDCFCLIAWSSFVIGFSWCSFEELVSYLKQPATLAKAKALLQAIHDGCINLHGQSTVVPRDVNVRVFLSAFMIVYHHSSLFDSMGPLETNLRATAGPMLESFEAISKGLKNSRRGWLPSVSIGLTVNFVPLFEDFYCRFKEWKVPDEKRLLGRLKEALITLYVHEALVARGETRLQGDYQERIEQIREKIRSIAGVEELDAFDEETRGVRTGAQGHSPIVAALGREGVPLSGDGGVFSSSNGTALVSCGMTHEELAHELLYDPCFQVFHIFVWFFCVGYLAVCDVLLSLVLFAAHVVVSWRCPPPDDSSSSRWVMA
jgi:hypothetical protein